MTDNEIIKSLSVHRDRFDYNCFGCSYRGIKCSFDLAGDAFDLINRQKAEIERLQAENTDLKKSIETMTNEHIKLGFEAKKRIENAKSEAIKEFWKMLKRKAFGIIDPDSSIKVVDVADGDNLVKEMEGGTNE